jgi:hypothetical protein
VRAAAAEPLPRWLRNRAMVSPHLLARLNAIPKPTSKAAADGQNGVTVTRHLAGDEPEDLAPGSRAVIQVWRLRRCLRHAPPPPSLAYGRARTGALARSRSWW